MMMNQNFCSCYQKKIFKNGATLLCWMKVISKSHSMTANQFKLLSCSPPILDIVFRAHSGNSPPLPLSSNSIIWIRVGDYLHPLPKCQHGMQLNCFWSESFSLLQNSLKDHFTFYWPHFLCRFAYTALDSESLEERPVSTLLSAIKARLLARKYQQLWDGNTSSSDMEILETLKYWQLELLGIWGTNMRSVCAGQYCSAYLPRPFSEGFPQGCDQWQ